MDDLSGRDVTPDDWLDRNEQGRVLAPLLAELGRVYVPVMLANARAVNEGSAEVAATVDGRPWVQQAFPYQGRCVAELRARRARLDPADRDAVDRLLRDTGCEALFNRAESR